MTLARAVTFVIAVVMLAALVYGFGWGGGWAEVRDLMRSPWFVVSLIDVYAGFALFACWIALRERPAVAVPWIVALLLLGNLVAAIYAFVALTQARGDRARLFLGARADRQPAHAGT